MEPRELSQTLLEVLVSVVATLGELAATVAGPSGDVKLAERSLHVALGTFINHLRDTLGHQHDTSLGQALAALEATPGATWAHVRATASTWQESVTTLEARWHRLAMEATELRNACRDAATAEATTEATATALAGDLRDKAARWGKAGGNLVATARQWPVALDKEEMASVLAAHKDQVTAAANEVVAATKAMEEANVAASQRGAATRRRQRAEAALGPLGHLVDACERATQFPQELQRQLGDIKAALEGAKEVSPDVPKALVAKVAEAERLWEASTRLVMRHLLGTLGDIRRLLSSPLGGPGGSTVAERCKRAIEDIPGLLQGQ